MKIAGIYKITSPTGKVYIGQSWDILQRFKGYKFVRCYKQTIIFRSLKKYGPDSHKFEIIHELPQDGTQSVMDNYEKFYIDFYRNAGIELMNIREGGSNGRLHPDSVEKMRKAITGRKLSPEHIEKTRLRMIGKKTGLGNKHTEEWKIESGLRHKGKKYALGAKHTDEMNKHKSNIMKGNKHSEGNVQSIQEKWKRALAIKIFHIKKNEFCRIIF